jgi:hypothetical protein
MNAIVLPDIDLDALRKSMPSLAEVELPSLQKAGKSADETIDRLRGRNQGPSWPWIAAGIFTIGLIGTLVALITWSRRTATFADAAVTPEPYAGMEPKATDPYGSNDAYSTSESMPA